MTDPHYPFRVMGNVIFSDFLYHTCILNSLPIFLSSFLFIHRSDLSLAALTSLTLVKTRSSYRLNFFFFVIFSIAFSLQFSLSWTLSPQPHTLAESLSSALSPTLTTNSHTRGHSLLNSQPLNLLLSLLETALLILNYI